MRMSERERSSMDRKIFGLGLSVEAVSLYILCAALVDEGRTVSTKSVTPTWNSDAAALTFAFGELERRGVLRKILSDLVGNDAYRIMDSAEWR